MDTNFEDLSPAEIATLWLANDIDKDNSDKPTILASNSTLTLMVVLAEGFVRLKNENVAEKALNEIKNYSKELVKHIESRGSYVRYDQPVRKLIQNLDEMGFPVIPENHIEKERKKERSKSTISYEQASESYKKALSSLEAQELLIDPPWYKTTVGVGSLIVLLGSVPLEINMKTVKGQSVTTSISSKFWDYNNVQTENTEDMHINIKIAKFLDKAVENMGSGFVDAWKEQNKTRVTSLEKEAKKVTHNK